MPENQPAPEPDSSSTSARPCEDEYLYKVVDALDEVAKEVEKTVPQVALNWLLQRPTVATIIIGARNEEQLAPEPRFGRVEPDQGAGRQARSRKRGPR